MKEDSLIYEMKFKNLFKVSFNPMAKLKEGDDDLDLDILKNKSLYFGDWNRNVFLFKKRNKS